MLCAGQVKNYKVSFWSMKYTQKSSDAQSCTICYNRQNNEAYPSLKEPTFGNVSTLINMLVLYFTFAQYQYLEDI